MGYTESMAYGSCCDNEQHKDYGYAIENVVKGESVGAWAGRDYSYQESVGTVCESAKCIGESAKCIGKRDYEVIAASPEYYAAKGLAVAVGACSESRGSVCESIPAKAEGIPVMGIGHTSIDACPRYYEEKYQEMVSCNRSNTDELNYGIAYGRIY